MVAEGANTYSLSVAAGRIAPTASALTFADGMAVRVPDATALDVIRRGADRIVEVSDSEIAEAVRLLTALPITAQRAPGQQRLRAF